ncbi:lactococcin 972 family bacteriocin [Leuconostoc gelidum]|uniref:lactococcin 972 family bacteriocin n=1 Tax=Leuconostoc gelidum TaxID=1244 RepID=UPI001C7D5C00|nr:lactococcin 972 family bacteriocin [Leuconostoc gelidum]MBZ6009937.1 lactococcin 972 family bacteriocin [Leuconostoc gelidum subsp. aenigmaticum]
MNIKKLAVASATALTLVGVAMPALASADSWNYGYTASTAYSNYYRGMYWHGSKVVNRNNGTTKTANNRAGVWSQATIADLWDPASFYYSNTGY